MVVFVNLGSNTRVIGKTKRKQNGATHFQLNRSVAQETVLVQLGTYGTVLGEYSDTRLVVRFDQRMDGLEQVRMDDENGKLGLWNEHQKRDLGLEGWLFS